MWRLWDCIKCVWACVSAITRSILITILAVWANDILEIVNLRSKQIGEEQHHFRDACYLLLWNHTIINKQKHTHSNMNCLTYINLCTPTITHFNWNKMNIYEIDFRTSRHFNVLFCGCMCRIVTLVLSMANMNWLRICIRLTILLVRTEIGWIHYCFVIVTVHLTTIKFGVRCGLSGCSPAVIDLLSQKKQFLFVPFLKIIFPQSGHCI